MLMAGTTLLSGDSDKGLEVLMARMKAGKHVTDEVISMLKERANIEEDYGKRLTKLAKAFNPREESGTLRDSLDVVRSELESSARAHLDVANEIRNQLEKPMSEFFENQNGIRRNHNTIVEKHLKQKASLTSSVAKCKERYEAKCIELRQLTNQKSSLPPKEMDKVKVKIEKTQQQLKQSDVDYLTGVEKLADVHRKWEEDFRTACRECQKLEEDRIDHLRSSMWNYANMLSSLCVADDESCERIRGSLEKCDVEKDIQLFLDGNATGSEIPPPLKYVNFYTDSTPSTSLSRPSASSNFNSDNPQSISEYNNSYPTNSSSTSGGGAQQRNLTSPLTSSGSKTGFEGFLAGMTGGVFGSQNSNSNAPVSGSGGFAEAKVKQSQSPPQQMTQPLGDFEEQGGDLFQYDPYDIRPEMPTLFSVRVLYDYQAQSGEELNIARGQTIPVFATHDDGWWEGYAFEGDRKRKGLFPSNFTEEIK
ncbi:hypothetical protein HDV05_003898 [Chytridiales sp. JEL 0842]|nr:hypothetical protein HDV05_003898 [Chytridiales sp. JEL 0842]